MFWAYVTIGLVSAATLLLELSLLRLFAVQQFYHFAFMAISLALLGAGASGSILSYRGRPFSPAVMSLAFALSTLGAYLVINYLPFDSFSIAWDSRQLLYLALYFLAAAGPFLFAGLVIGGELMIAGAGGRGSHQVYGANLIGSAAGSLASLPILAAFGGEGTVVVAIILGATAGLIFALLEYRSRGKRPGLLVVSIISAGMIGAGILALLHPPSWLAQRLSPYKTLSILSQALDSEHILTAWDATARVDVVESGTIHMMPGLSLAATESPPLQAGLMLDGDNMMPITGIGPDSQEARALAGFLPNGLAYRLRPGARTLVIEAGTGMDVLFALASGAAQVTAVEENTLVSEVVKNRYGAFTGGLYRDPRVKVVDQSGRVFARQSSSGSADGTYDLAIVALTDPHRPVTSGAYSLTEDYIHTVEAFGDYLRTLDDRGLLVVTRWQQSPPSESARTFGAMVAALERAGLDPAGQLIAFRSLRTMTILAGRQAFSPDEIDIVRDFLTQNNYDAVYYPGIEQSELNRYNELPEPVYHDLFSRILTDAEGTYDDYRFEIRPPTDDRPFFFHYFKWRQTPEILATLGLTWQPFGGSGYFVLVALLILVALASAVFIVGPLLLRGDSGFAERTALSRGRVFIYFACLGLAFLFVEIPLAQRFILILDQPVIALAVVLFAILLFSGLGSLTVRRWRLPLGLALLILLIVVYPLLLRPATGLFLAQPLWARILCTIAIIAPLGYLMGLPFAGGLQVVEKYQPGLVPWAWAINGSFSVISAVLAVMVALSWGFSAVLWLGAIAYAGALITFSHYWRNDKVRQGR